MRKKRTFETGEVGAFNLNDEIKICLPTQGIDLTFLKALAPLKSQVK